MVQENENNELEELEEEGLGQEVDKLLEQGYSQKEIREQGFSPALVRQRVRKRTKRLGKQPPENQNGGGKGEIALTVKEKETVLPEWLEQQVGELYDGDEKTRKVFMAGMSIPLLGMRLFSESFKPMLELMRVDQARHAEAAKAAAGGSEEVARQTVAHAIPYFEQIAKDASIASSPNPLQSLMVTTMQPYLTQALSGMMGMFTPKTPQPDLKQAPPQQPKQAEATEAEVREAFG